MNSNVGVIDAVSNASHELRIMTTDGDPLVSIIVGVMNEAETVEASLRSILNIEYPNFEIIIVDGGSSDGTVDRVRALAQGNRKLHLIEQEGYLSAARNAGARAAKGEIFAYTDADCIVTRTWLRHLVAPLVQGTSVVVGVGGPNVISDKVQNVWTSVLKLVLDTFIGSAGSVQVRSARDEYVRSVSGSNSAFRAATVREFGGFDERLSSCEDADLCARMVKRGHKLRFVTEAIVYHLRSYHNLGNFGHHMYGYGRGRGEAILLKPRTDMNPTAAAILTLIVSETVLIVSAVMFGGVAEAIFVAFTAAYFILVLSTSIIIARGNFKTSLAAAAGFLVLHISYATGLLRGLISGIGKIIGGRKSS